MKWQEMHGMDQEEEHHPGRLAGPTERIPKLVHDILHQDERDAVKDILEEYRIRKPNGHRFHPGRWSGKNIPETWEEDKPLFEINFNSLLETKKKEEEKEKRLMKQAQVFLDRAIKEKEKEEEEERRRIQKMINKGLEEFNRTNSRLKEPIYPELSFDFNKPEISKSFDTSVESFLDKELKKYGLENPFKPLNSLEEEKSWEMPKIPIPPKTHFSFGDDSDTEAALRRKEWKTMEKIWQNAPSGYEFGGGVDNTSRVDTECGAFKVTPPMAPGFGPVNDVDSNGVIIPRKRF